MHHHTSGLHTDAVVIHAALGSVDIWDSLFDADVIQASF